MNNELRDGQWIKEWRYVPSNPKGISYLEIWKPNILDLNHSINQLIQSSTVEKSMTFTYSFTPLVSYVDFLSGGDRTCSNQISPLWLRFQDFTCLRDCILQEMVPISLKVEDSTFLCLSLLFHIWEWRDDYNHHLTPQGGKQVHWG